MTSAPESRIGLTRALITIAVAATIAYGASAATIGRPIVFSDAFNYNVGALRLLETGVFQYGGPPDMNATPVPNAFTTPGYTVFLSSVYAVLPRTGDTIDNILTAQPYIIIIQLLLAVATAVVIAYTGWRLAGPAAGWTAGILAVAYLPFGMNTTVTLTENLATPLMAVVLLSAVIAFPDSDDQSRHRLWWVVLFGVVGGLSILVRPAIGPWLIVPLAMSLWIRKGHTAQELKMIGVALACMILVVSPWIVRNAVVLDEFIPLTTGASTALLDSVGGAVYSESDKQVIARAEAVGDDPLSAVAVARLKARWAANPLRFLAWKGYTLGKGVGKITDLPGDYATYIKLEGTGSAAYADAGEFTLMTDASGHETLSFVLNWYHRALIVLAAIGAVLSRRRPLVWILALIPVYYALAHTIVLFMARYFYPAMPAILLLAALAVTHMHGMTARIRRPPSTG